MFFVMQNIQIFYRGPVMFIVTCFLVHPDCRNFLSEYCKSIIIQQLRGEELPSLLPLLQVDIFSREAGYIAANQPMPVKQTIKSLTLVIQIIPPKFLQECTSILQLKVYIIYVVRKLV